MSKKEHVSFIEKIKNDKRPFYKRWYFWVALVLVIGVIGYCIKGGNIDIPKYEKKETSQKEEKQHEEKNGKQDEQAKEDKQENNKNEDSGGVGGSGMEEGDIELACQDAKYYEGSSYYKSSVKRIIRITDYNKYFTVVAHTKDGDKPIVQFTWNGTDKNGGKISFVCYAIKNNDNNIIPVQIKSGTHDIWKTDADFMAIVKQ